MAQEQRVSKETAREMARLAGLSIPEERLQQVAEAFNSLLPAIDRMMALDLGDVEPAPIFRHR
ncbi:MAG: aspartyl/glutamyl-tRNA amidotransferase subunit C, partial [Dehalococcoidia bacterium]